MHCPLKSIKMNFNDLTRAIKYDMCNLRSFTMSTNCLYLTYQGKYEKHIDKNKEIAESKSMQTTFYSYVGI